MGYIEDESIGWIIYKTRFLLKNKLQKVLKKHDITTEQWSILIKVYTKAGCNQRELAEGALKDRAALTRILDILERKELLKRKSSTNDRRAFLVYLTEKGYDLIDSILPIVIENEKANFKAFNDAETEQLKDLLKKLISSLR